MARIPGLDDTLYGNHTLGNDWYDTNQNGEDELEELIPVELGNSTVLYKLMHYARDLVIQGYSEIELEHFEGPPQGYFSKAGWFGDSRGAFAPMVCVYKVNYD
jgi:hypothetical protein